MKILAISDVHGEDNENLYKYLNNNDIDIVIITGDITNFGPLEFVDEFIGKILGFGEKSFSILTSIFLSILTPAFALIKNSQTRS